MRTKKLKISRKPLAQQSEVRVATPNRRWPVVLLGLAVGVALIAAAILSGTHGPKSSPQPFARTPLALPSDRIASAQAAYDTGERELAEGHVFAAEQHLRQALEQDPHHLAANNRLSYLLG
ncbi:MAG: hypothetical protein ABI614_29065, partial [Planctomycetota bacterium]